MTKGSRLWARWADWRSVRVWESETRYRLRQRHWLWLHGWCIGLLVLLAMWGAAHLQFVMGSESLALRYGVTLGVGYAVFLLVLRWWGGLLVGEDDGVADPGLSDGGDAIIDGVGQLSERAATVFRSGRGGDFGGSGASADFSDAADGAASGADLASGVADAVGGADEGAIVVIPVLAMFALGSLVVAGAGSLLLLYFGADVLLAVAVEVAFGYVTAHTAVKVAREGWVTAALRLTWKPLLGALASAVMLGAALDWWVPESRSLPHAVQLLRSR